MKRVFGFIMMLFLGCSHAPAKPAPVKSARQSTKVQAQKDQKSNVDLHDPHFSEAKANYEKGLRALTANNFSDAAKSFDQAILAGERYALPYHGRGLVSFREGKFKEAASYFSKAVSIKPNFSPGLNGLALSQRNLGQFGDAEQAYLAAIKYDKTNSVYHYNLGILYDVYLGRPEKALMAYQEYLKMAGNAAEKKVEKWVELIELKQ